MKKQSKNIKLQERDLEILIFLFKWKLASTELLKNRFFSPHASSSTTVSRLKKLEASGYISLLSKRKGRQDLWELTKKGFNHSVLDHYDPSTIKEKSFSSSNTEHDLAIQATLIGPFLKDSPKNFHVISDNMLKALDQELITELTGIDTSHRADGYWINSDVDSSKTVALEVELNVKAKHRYAPLISFYSQDSDLSHLVWVIKSPGDAKRIHQAMNDEFFSTALLPQSFLLLQDIKNIGWNAHCILGDSLGDSLFQILLRENHDKGTRKLQECCDKSDPNVFFNLKRFPLISNSYKKNRSPLEL